MKRDLVCMSCCCCLLLLLLEALLHGAGDRSLHVRCLLEGLHLHTLGTMRFR